MASTAKRGVPDEQDEGERATCKTTVPAGFCGWHEVALPAGFSLPAKDSTCDADLVLVTLDRNPNLIWSVLATHGENQPARVYQIRAEAGTVKS